MDISAGSISVNWPKSYMRNGTRDEHKHLDRKYEQQICLYFLKKHLISLGKPQFCFCFYVAGPLKPLPPPPWA